LWAPWFTLSWLPIALGIAFNLHAHVIDQPYERVLTTAGGSPSLVQGRQDLASAHGGAWFDAGQATVGGEQ